MRKPGLKMSELADASGVSAATIKHYLREGLLDGDGEIVRTSRNMAYYPPEFVDGSAGSSACRSERFLPLRLIKVLLDEQGGGRVPRAEVERALRRAGQRAGPARGDRRADARATAAIDPDDVKIVEAIARFRAGGYDEAIGFTVYDTLRYRDALQPLVEEEVRVLLERLGGDVEPDDAVEIMRSGREPLRDLVGAMHSKLLLAEFLRRASEPSTSRSAAGASAPPSTPPGRGTPRSQHAGPPAALLGRALERCEPREGTLLARITFEILGPVPVAEVEVESRVVRPGRTVELLEATLSAGGRPAMTARAWRLPLTDVAARPASGAAPLARPAEADPPLHDFGYGHAVEWRFAARRLARAGAGDGLDAAEGAAWCADEEPSPLQRVLAVADSGSGVSAVLCWDEWLFINPELTLHVLRPPRGRVGRARRGDADRARRRRARAQRALRRARAGGVRLAVAAGRARPRA